MKNGIVICDVSPIFSLAIIDQLNLLNELFNSIYIPNAVWEEITQDTTPLYYSTIFNFFKDKVREISSFNDLALIMDYGESESVLLYRELAADFLLIDDKKARKIAEHLGVNCIGIIGILSTAKDKELIETLKPLFVILLANKQYYSLRLMNMISNKHGEENIS